MIKQRFQVRGMSCVGCAMEVDGVLEDLPGVKCAATNFARQFSDVEYDERKLTPAQILAAIQAAGFQAQL